MIKIEPKSTETQGCQYTVLKYYINDIIICIIEGNESRPPKIVLFHRVLKQNSVDYKGALTP